MTGRANQSPGKLPATARWLGRLGLIPFIALAACILLANQPQTLLTRALAAYSFGILSFLAGAWWGLALVKRHPSALLLSNTFFLVVFFSYLLLSTRAYLVVGAVVFMALLIVEQTHPLFRPQPAYYARMRIQLSVTAAVTLLLAATVPA